MPIIVENKLITLNSRYAQKFNGTFNSNMVFNFRGILVPDDDIISSNICVMNAQLPVSWYIINETNYLFTITPPGFGALSIALTFGNYNANTLITEVLARFNTYSTGTTLSIAISQVTGKLTFTFSASSTIIFPTTSPLGANYSARVFGYEPGISYTGTTIAAPYPLNLLGINRLAIRSNKLTISSYNSVTLNLGITLATVPVDVPAFSLLNYSNQTDLNKAELKIDTINEIDIIIVDENNDFVNFNNTDWTMTLVLENVRSVPDKYLPSFRSLVEPPTTQVSNDIKDLELLA
jgi:hypothetical protein